MNFLFEYEVFYAAMSNLTWWHCQFSRRFNDESVDKLKITYMAENSRYGLPFDSSVKFMYSVNVAIARVISATLS